MKKKSKKRSAKRFAKESINLESNIFLNTIGYDLFLSKQMVINSKKKNYFYLNFNSKIFYEMITKKKELYKPSKFINFTLTNKEYI